MAHVNVTPEVVLSKILNEVCDEGNDGIEEIASLAFDKENMSQHRRLLILMILTM